jgi:hypothetical protein
MGGAASGMMLGYTSLTTGDEGRRAATLSKQTATVRGAFIYPPSEKLRVPGGWWSWPGKDFDAEGRQRQYMAKIKQIEARLDIRILMDEEPLDLEASVTRFIGEVKDSSPDGLLLIPLKHGHFAHVDRILKEVSTPTIVFTCLGVKHGSVKGYQRPGVCLIQALDNVEALEYSMRMIKTAKTMKQSRIIRVGGSTSREYQVPHIGTHVRVLPMQKFVGQVERTEATRAVTDLARSYMESAKRILEPEEAEIISAARVHLANKRILKSEKGDAIMIDCLRRGLYMPCMSFMSLRDEGIAAGCENDLSATLTLMLVQHLFDRPGFQHNPCFETEKNHYFASHCTSASRLFGTTKPPEPYFLRDYAHTNDPTCVPQVLWRVGEEVTMAHYEPGEKPRMLLYSGNVVQSYDMPPVGGCRTNVEITINELDDVCDVKGHHNVLFYGDYVRQLRKFAQLYNIAVAS